MNIKTISAQPLCRNDYRLNIKSGTDIKGANNFTSLVENPTDRYLVGNQGNISFKSNTDWSIKEKYKYADKLAYLLSLFSTGEVVLVGKNCRESLMHLQKNLPNVRFLIDTIRFLPQKNIDGYYAFYKDSDGVNLLNINDLPIEVASYPENKKTEYGSKKTAILNKESFIRLNKSEFIYTPKVKDYECENYIDEYSRTFTVANQEKISEQNNQTIEKLLNRTTTATSKKHSHGLNGFKRVGGQDKAINELKRGIIYPTMYPEFFKGIKPERGIILYGPPGTGKSLLANALSEEWGSYFESISASEMSSKWVGESEKNWRDLFNRLKQNQPAILFVDEAEALCKTRGGHDVYGDKELNEFLKLVSDLREEDANVYVILATNRRDALDSAILRKGRFGKQIEMLPPQTVKDVSTIFDIHTKKLTLSKALNREDICKKLFEAGATGAEIEFVAGQAHSNALERLSIFDRMEQGIISDADKMNFCITDEDFYTAIEQISSSKKSERKMGFKKEF